MGKHYERFDITGTASRQDEISTLAKYNDDYQLKNKELVEEGYDEATPCYKYYFDIKDTQLVPEGNAIKVIADGVHVGYAKESDCARIKELMGDSEVLLYKVFFQGGPYRYAEEVEDEDGETELQNERGEDDYSGKIVFVIHDDSPEPAEAPIASDKKGLSTDSQRKMTKIILIVLAVLCLVLSLVYPFMLVVVIACIVIIIKWKKQDQN